MGTRSFREVRCERCRMHKNRCICEHIPSLPTETHVALVMHCREFKKPTATAPLALESLPNSKLYLHGVSGDPLDLHHLHDDDRRLLVLYPSRDAKVLTPDFRESDPRPITLVVPDGNWRQASRVPKRVPGLTQAERVILPAGDPTRWGVRRETKKEGLATFEAIARALGILESEEVQLRLEALFDTMVKVTFEMRGYEKGTIPS